MFEGLAILGGRKAATLAAPGGPDRFYDRFADIWRDPLCAATPAQAG